MRVALVDHIVWGICYLPLLALQHSVGQLCRLQCDVWVLQRLQNAMLAYALLLLRILFANVVLASSAAQAAGAIAIGLGQALNATVKKTQMHEAPASSTVR